MKSYFYTITIDDETKYYYLGDNKDLTVLKNTLKLLRPGDLLFTDISFKKSKVHLELNEILNIADKSQFSQIYCMHFDSKKTIKIANNLGFRIAKIE